MSTGSVERTAGLPGRAGCWLVATGTVPPPTGTGTAHPPEPCARLPHLAPSPELSRVRAPSCPRFRRHADGTTGSRTADRYNPDPHWSRGRRLLLRVLGGLLLRLLEPADLGQRVGPG